MQDEIKDMMKKVDAIYTILADSRTAGLPSHDVSPALGSEAKLKRAIRKAITELEMTKSSFKSKQIMRIKEELARAVEEKL